MKNDPALKLCPFCGGRAAIAKVTYTIDNKEYFFANCIECQARCTDATGSMYDTPEEAAKAWNRRTQSVRDVLDDFKKYHEGYKQAVIDMTTSAAIGASYKQDAQVEEEVEEEDDGGPAPRPVKEEVPAHPWKPEAKPVKTAAEIKAFEQGFDLCLRMFDCFAKMEKTRSNLFQSGIISDKVEAAKRDRARSVTLFRYGEYEVALDAATYKGEPK